MKPKFVLSLQESIFEKNSKVFSFLKALDEMICGVMTGSVKLTRARKFIDSTVAGKIPSSCKLDSTSGPIIFIPFYF